jgi:hypothetical protein
MLAMKFDWTVAGVNILGQLLILTLLITNLWIALNRKNALLLCFVFAVTSIVETIYIGWRLLHPDVMHGALGVIFGSLPSFLIGLGLPFATIYFHHIIPDRIKVWLHTRHFPLFPQHYFDDNTLNTYHRTGLLYGSLVLFGNEMSQVLEFSMRNTFDFSDICFIGVGLLVNKLVFNLYCKWKIKTAPRTAEMRPIRDRQDVAA